ncbi:MAG: (d)CMP kinase [Elusimicrobia bacterium]|nr:(d)CMP kinase [Elusimicrobiota bacterium]
MRRKPIVAIDGPAGAGKSTIAKIVARELGFLYIDTGAMYRAMTWKMLKCKVNFKDENKIIQIANKTNIELKQLKDKLKVSVDGTDVTKKIRTEIITKNVNTIAAIQGVRKVLRSKQHKIGQKGGIVMEGRDIGTTVFPSAEKKFYLDAKPKERALRRWKELKAEGKRGSLENIAAAIRKRDYRDRNRRVSPLIKAKDAIVIDSTALTLHQVAQKILNEINKP